MTGVDFFDVLAAFLAIVGIVFLVTRGQWGALIICLFLAFWAKSHSVYLKALSLCPQAENVLIVDANDDYACVPRTAVKKQ
jgi:hypothetical protein